ncbi:MAG: universal stress protein [Vicinamibacterales bacterium]
MSLPTAILCPIDFSPAAERALRHAMALSGLVAAHLTVVTVNDPLLVAAASASGHEEALNDQMERALLETLERVPAPDSPLLPALDIVTGDPADEILKAAERAGAGLVVMGTRGLGAAGRLLFGSTAERVIRDAHVPVLVVPDLAPDRLAVEHGTAMQSIGHVVASVGLDATDTLVAAAAGEWAATFGTPLTLAHVCPDIPTPAWWPFARPGAESVDEARTRLQSLARSVPTAGNALIDARRGNVAEGLSAIVRDRDAGLLVVSRGSGAHRLGATAYRLMANADVPTLVVAGA